MGVKHGSKHHISIASHHKHKVGVESTNFNAGRAIFDGIQVALVNEMVDFKVGRTTVIGCVHSAAIQH
jgi:hypothetical protein